MVNGEYSVHIEVNMMTIILFPVLYDHVERKEDSFLTSKRLFLSVSSVLASAISSDYYLS